MVLAVTRHHVDFGFVWLLPIALIVATLLLAALALMLGAVNVYARDTQHLLDLALLGMFWLNPILYEYHRMATWFTNRGWPSWIPLLNPFASIIITFQRAIYGTTTAGSKQLLPSDGPLWYLRNLAVVGVFAFALFLLALRWFDRAEGNFAEVI